MLEETYGHTPVRKMFHDRDVYGVAYDAERACRRPVRLAAIGAGGVAVSKYFPAIKRLQTIWEPVELCAIVRPDEEPYGRHIARTWNTAWYADHETMLDRERPDGVLILSPNEMHAEHALACIERGISVLVEKPFSLTLNEARQVCEMAERNNVPILAVANKRYSPPYRRARRLLDEGAVPNPVMFSAKFNLGYDYVTQMLEAGTIHVLDLARYFLGDVGRVYAIGINKFRRSGEPYPFDNALISMEYVSGGVGQVLTSSTACSLKPWERVEIYGENAWLNIEDQYRLTLYNSEEGPAQSWTPVIPNTLLFDEEFGGYMAQVENLLQVIRGAEQPGVTGWDGYHACELTVATLLSLGRRAAVDLPLDAASADRERAELLRCS